MGPKRVDLRGLRRGSPCWLTSDPQRESRFQRMAERSLEEQRRPLVLKVSGSCGTPLQLEVLSQGHGDSTAYWRKEDFQEALDSGVTTLSVPKTPITGYAGKNPEEAFCEAVGLLVAYGPRAVHEKIRHYLEIVIPGKVKLARENLVNRYLALAV